MHIYTCTCTCRSTCTVSCCVYSTLGLKRKKACTFYTHHFPGHIFLYMHVCSMTLRWLPWQLHWAYLIRSCLHTALLLSLRSTLTWEGETAVCVWCTYNNHVCIRIACSPNMLTWLFTYNVRTCNSMMHSANQKAQLLVCFMYMYWAHIIFYLWSMFIFT